MIFPNQIVGFLPGRITKREGPLKIFKQDSIWQTFHFGQKSLIQPFRLRPIASAVEQDETLAQLQVLRLIMADLAQDHHAAKHQERKKDEMKPVLSAKRHNYWRWLSCGLAWIIHHLKE
jgi:hypothetical protein